MRKLLQVVVGIGGIALIGGLPGCARGVDDGTTYEE